MGDKMKKEKNNNGVLLVLGIFFICTIVKDIEFIFIKTDQTFLAENIICKIFCILLIGYFLHSKGWKWSDIGFKKNGVAKGLFYGFSLGIITFAMSYLIEFIILWSMGKQPHLGFFVTNFSISNQNITGISVVAIVICIFGNVINVWAEEGLFRGLLLKIGLSSLSEKKSNLLQSLLFGVWHIVTVIVWLIDGSINIPTAIVMAIGYIVLAGVLGYEWGVCVKLTGTVWTGIFEHFFNNFISNSLHTITATGIDELQIIRIALSNILSLSIVLIAAKISKKNIAENNDMI